MSETAATLPRWSRIAAPALLAAAAAAATVALAAGGGSRVHAIAHPHTVRHSPLTHRATALAAEAPDPLAAQSYPNPAGAARHAPAAAPSVAGALAAASPGAPSVSQVEQQLRAERHLERQLRQHSVASLLDPISGAFAPRNVVPEQIAQVIAGGNAIADFPYVYGGGHGSFIDRAYDCSGSVSYALAAAGLIAGPETSGQLERWGVRGPGRYLTVFANAGHAFMNVDGIWFDTAGRAGPYSTRWLAAKPSLIGYAVRHYPGL